MDTPFPIKIGWSPIDNMCTTTTLSLEDAVLDVEKDVITTTDISSSPNDSSIVPSSDLSRTDRIIWVVTTAALPWRTGTSVNPLARALYLTRGRPKHSVTLMVPFLSSKEEQKHVFGDTLFDSPEQHEEWIRTYCKERVHCGGMLFFNYFCSPSTLWNSPPSLCFR